MAALAVAAAALSLLSAAASSKAAFNLYLKQHESRRLFGLDVELYYVKEGRRNEYALGFVVPVPANVSELEFVWQALGPLPLAYALDVQVNEGRGHRALGAPSLDVSPRGTLPAAPRSFRVRLPCTGLASAEVPVRIVLNVSAVAPPDAQLFHHDGRLLQAAGYDLPPAYYGTRPANTSVSLPRNKICAKDAQSTDEVAGFVHSPVASSTSSSSRSLVVAAGCSCAVLAALALTAAVAWLVRVRKPPPSRDAPLEEPSWQTWSSPDGRPLSCGPPWMLGAHRDDLGPRRDHSPPAVRPASGSVGEPDTVHSDFTQRLAEIHVDRRKVTFLEKLHQGTFGQIFHGLLVEDWAEVGAEQNVLIKTVTGEASAAQAALAVREGLSLLGMNHANVLSVVGAACDGQPLLLYPYMNAGNLKRFLKQADQVLVTQDLVDMAIQVAEGLQYLHKRAFVHRDVGTRNCVVDDRLHVKLTDNALSRDLFPDDYHCLGDGENRPIKWLALESLERGLFSPSSDIWMFGVALWELMTLAQQPYAELDPFEVGEQLEQGYRLAQPINCPDPLYLVMDTCWRADPEQRPSSAVLLRLLADLYAALNRFI
ncbi:tyrosine-protein kinase RYK-like [Dermacentor variabilis]|uniref:tyrosine-protein kinase RYK-like n=1 Tax=Dermacentor variabilis TaxID=34621 RepID=UPI003F5C16B0